MTTPVTGVGTGRARLTFRGAVQNGGLRARPVRRQPHFVAQCVRPDCVGDYVAAGIVAMPRVWRLSGRRDRQDAGEFVLVVVGPSCGPRAFSLWLSLTVPIVQAGAHTKKCLPENRFSKKK